MFSNCAVERENVSILTTSFVRQNQSLNKYSIQRREITGLGSTTKLRYPQRHFKYWAGWGVERDIIIIIVIIIIIIIIIIIL